MFFEKLYQGFCGRHVYNEIKKDHHFYALTHHFLFLFHLQHRNSRGFRFLCILIQYRNGINQTKEYYDMYFSTSKDSCTCHPRVISVDVMNAFSIHSSHSPAFALQIMNIRLHCIN